MATEERHVRIVALPDKPAEMVIRDMVPLCIRLCEPVCAESEYQVSATILHRPVWTVTVKGITRFFNCKEKP